MVLGHHRDSVQESPSEGKGGPVQNGFRVDYAAVDLEEYARETFNQWGGHVVSVRTSVPGPNGQPFAIVQGVLADMTPAGVWLWQGRGLEHLSLLHVIGVRHGLLIGDERCSACDAERRRAREDG